MLVTGMLWHSFRGRIQTTIASNSKVRFFLSYHFVSVECWMIHAFTWLICSTHKSINPWMIFLCTCVRSTVHKIHTHIYFCFSPFAFNYRAHTRCIYVHNVLHNIMYIIVYKSQCTVFMSHSDRNARVTSLAHLFIIQLNQLRCCGTIVIFASK